MPNYAFLTWHSAKTRRCGTIRDSKYPKYLSFWTFLFLLESQISFFSPLLLLISYCIDWYIHYTVLRVFPSFFSSCIENISAAVSYFYAVDQLIISLSVTNVFLMYLNFFHGTKSMKGIDTASSAHFYYHGFEIIHPVESIRFITWKSCSVCRFRCHISLARYSSSWDTWWAQR